ncbi:DUF3742 domain-containing protein [Providencia rettgeri]
MSKTTVSRGENWGIKAAHGSKWLIRRLKTFDKRGVAKAKSKNWPDWVGHLPLFSIASCIIIFFVTLSLISLFFLFFFIVTSLIFNGQSLANIDLSVDDESHASAEEPVGPIYMHGNQGEGWYTDDSGSIKVDD